MEPITLHSVEEKDKDTEGVRAFNKLMFADDRYYSTIIPLRDGVAIGLRVS